MKKNKKKEKEKLKREKRESEKTLQLNTACDSGLDRVCLCVFMVLLRYFERLEWGQRITW